MTPEQKDTLIGMFQMGMACGLEHPFEFFSNYIRHLGVYDYKKVPELEKKAYEAMLEFMKGCDGCEEEQDFYNSLDIVKLNEHIDKWYKHRRQHLDKLIEERAKKLGS
jgi:hypothetical protein